jgi:protein gp37
MKQKGNKIGWCDITVNPVQGCPKGCVWDDSECYAKITWNRHKGQPGWCKDFKVPEFFPHRLKDFRTKEPLIIFIDSMSDIGYWEYDWKVKVISEMMGEPQNIYLALTKRYDALKPLRLWMDENNKIFCSLAFYIGATVTNNAQAQAVIDEGGADFISFEPLMERIRPELLEQLECRWWIVGDLTKNGRPQGVTKRAWVLNMLIGAILDDIPIFMKDSMREIMRHDFIQEFPEGWKTE